LEEIAAFAAKEASEATQCPVVAEDSGFFVHALGGFPGPYSSFVHRTIANQGILSLMRSMSNREAHFQAVVAFCIPKARPVCFSAIVKGTVSRRMVGKLGFGFDPIFVPDEGDGRTFAQMRIDEKNQFSHRARAFRQFFGWLTAKQRSRRAETS
jgi:XTP/dITP diphosphohydrolase